MGRDCPGCSRPVPAGPETCPHCGFRLPTTGVIAAPGTTAGGGSGGPRPGVSPRFEVRESLGTLGTTRCYAAVEKRTGTEVVLRLIPTSIAPNSEAVETLRAALTSVRGLEASPHVVRILGVEREGEQAYFVAEPFRGRTLMDRLRKERRLDPDEVIRLGLGVAHALQELHKANHVHGELRPGNVLLADEGGVFVTDVGVARELSLLAARSASSVGPQRGIFYRPPESGASDSPDRRHDLFALGCILFEAATASRRLPAAWESVASRNPTPGVAYPDPCGEHPELRKHLADVIRTFLAPNPRDRFPSIEDAIAALSGRTRPSPRVLPVMSGAAAAGAPAESAADIARGLRADADLASRGGAGAAGPSSAKVAGAAVVLLLAAAGAWAAWQFVGRSAGNGSGTAEDDGPPAPPAVPGLPPPPAALPDDAVLPKGVLRDGGRLFGHRDGAELVAVPAGEYVLGEKGTAEGPRRERRARLGRFLVDRHEVTVAQYRRFAAATGRSVPPQPPGGSDRHPVVGVSWHDAAAYAAWAGRRLPTEDEWEAVARGAGGAPFPWGAEDVASRRNGPGADDGHVALAPAAAYGDAGGPFGVFDLAGNAWEWCADPWTADGPAPAGAPAVERAVRGGSWRVPLPPAGVPFRNSAPPDVRWDDLGFRCVVSVP